MPTSVSGLAANRNDLNAAFVAFALALGDDAVEFGQRKMDDATVPWIHWLEGNDLALFDRLLAQSSGHVRERGLAAQAVAFGIYHNVPPLEIGSIYSSMRQKLERG